MFDCFLSWLTVCLGATEDCTELQVDREYNLVTLHMLLLQRQCVLD
jgi:hypothetical protein